jgi:DNA repair protein RadC
VVAAAQLLGIRVLDHLIVTDSASVFQSLAMLKPDLFNRLYSWQ